jgi:hypothetical protein
LRAAVTLVAVIVLIAALVLGAARRIGNPRLAFCGSTDEFSEFMPGLRLHALPLWNLRADVRSNFFQSLLYSPHGFGDSVFYYLASGVLNGLGLSISDRHLWLASAATNALLVAAVVGLALTIGRSAWMAYVATLLIALSPLYVFSSQTAFGRITFVPLLHTSALLAAAVAHRRPGWPSRALLVALAFFIELTDGFYFGPVLLVFLFVARGGRLGDRVAGTLRDRTFWWTAAAIAAGLSVDFALGALAAAHNTTLTLFGYVRIRAGYGGVLSALDLLKLWLQAFQRYIPIIGPAIVLPAWIVTLRYAWSDPLAGSLAAWLAIASAGVVRYYASSTGQHIPGVGPLTAYPLALPSYLVVAWACGRGLRAGTPPLARGVAIAACGAAALVLGAQLVTERYDADLRFRGPLYAADIDRCAVVKSASAYVREQAVPGGTVFHLSSQMPLAVFGEFYYGLSYLGNQRTGERNRLVDFGGEVLGRRYTPEQLAQAYGIPHFTYYVEFSPPADEFTAGAVRRLERAGARPALDVRDGARLLGRVWRFDATTTETMDVSEMSARWDRVGHLRQLFQQSLAGTAFHFGPAWPVR